jgi:hypothetical protein
VVVLGIFSLFTSFDCFAVVEEDKIEGVVVIFVATPLICLLLVFVIMEFVVGVIVDSFIGNILVVSINC